MPDGASSPSEHVTALEMWGGKSATRIGRIRHSERRWGELWPAALRKDFPQGREIVDCLHYKLHSWLGIMLRHASL